MKRFLLKLLTFALVAAALVLALRTPVLRQLWLWRGDQAVSKYRQTAQALDIMDCGIRLAQARAYNEAADSAEEQAELDALALNGDGVMAVLSIPKLGAPMPVYTGDSQTARQTGASHLAGASLPVGGSGARCALYGTRDGRFVELDRLIPGDCFYIEAIQDTLIYEVEQVSTAQGDWMSEPSADGDADICVLATETARSDEPEILLVRARRVSRREAPLADDTQPLPDWAARGILAVPVLLAGLILLTAVEAMRRGARRRRIRRIRI